MPEKFAKRNNTAFRRSTCDTLILILFRGAYLSCLSHNICHIANERMDFYFIYINFSKDIFLGYKLKGICHLLSIAVEIIELVE